MSNLKQFTQNLDISDDKEDLPDIEIEEIEIKFNDNIKDDIIDDYRYSRVKLVNMIQSAEGVLKHALIDMKNNPGPRPIEAFSGLLRAMNETSGKIFDLHEKMKKFQKEDEKDKNQKPEKDDSGKPKTLKANINDIIDAMNSGEDE